MNRPFINADDISDAAFLDNVKAVGNNSIAGTESSKTFNKLGEDAITAINTLHDGNKVRRSRSGPKGCNIKIEDARLTVSFGLQDSVFNTFIECKKGKYWSDVGAFNRFLICVPEIDYTNFPQHSVQYDTEELKQFRKRQECLLKTAFTPGYKRQLVKFEPAACDYWQRMSHWLYSQCAPGMYFHSVAGHAIKLRDLGPRIAAIIHVFEDFKGDISVSTLEYAFNIVLHYADYFVALFSPIEQSVLDAIEIDEIITERFRSQHGAYINPEERYIYLEKLKGYLPSKLKKPNRLHDALRDLNKMKRIEVYWARQEGSRSKKQWVDIYPCSQPYPPNWLQLEGGAL